MFTYVFLCSICFLKFYYVLLCFLMFSFVFLCFLIFVSVEKEIPQQYIPTLRPASNYFSWSVLILTRINNCCKMYSTRDSFLYLNSGTTGAWDRTVGAARRGDLALCSFTRVIYCGAVQSSIQRDFFFYTVPLVQMVERQRRLRILNRHRF